MSHFHWHRGRAGVLGLSSSDEVREVCDKIKTEGLPSGIQETFIPDLEDTDLLKYFRLLQKQLNQHPEIAVDDGRIRQIIKEAKE